MERVILHLDMDAFFAAIEERDKPWLKGKPIVVGADPNSPAGEGKGRGVVSTANYAARKYGIRSALPISAAWRLSEEARKRGEEPAVFVEGRYKRYTEVSRRIMDYVRTAAAVVEEASVDEVYFELATSDKGHATRDLWNAAEKKAREIQEHIKKTERLTCSVGIGPNKLIAKMASGMRKPDGLTVIRPEGVQAFLDPQPVEAIPGIGPKSVAALHKRGIQTIRDLRECAETEVVEMFGTWGSVMCRKARGIDDAPLIAEYEAKSVGEQETYGQDTLDAVFLTGRLKELSTEVFRRFVREGFINFRTVAVIVRFADFATVTRSHTLRAPAGDQKTLQTEALQLFLPFLDRRENPRKKLIRLLGVRVEKLVAQ